MLTALCEQIESSPISGVIVVGDGQAARSIALSGNAMKVPVLWAKGGTAQLHAGNSEVRTLISLFKVPSSAPIDKHTKAPYDSVFKAPNPASFMSTHTSSACRVCARSEKRVNPCRFALIYISRG